MTEPDASPVPTPERSTPKRKGKVKKRHTVGRVLLATSLVLALATGLGVVWLYRHLNGNLNVVDVSEQLGTDRPQKEKVEGPKEPLNVLVMGSDDRDAEGNNIDNQELGSSDRSDTTILFHLSADRERAYGISIPRDSLVTRPGCKDEDGDPVPGGTDVMWNEAFALAGPGCTIRQLEQLTGIFVDHYVVVDFAGFEGMVDAVDGVEVCIPEDIEDPAHGINIPAGTREIRGREALNYVRARYTLGDGSDIGRIARQQAFMSSMVNKVFSAGVLARPDRLVRFLNAATDSLTVDPGLENVAKIADLGLQFRDIGLDKIQFVTVPFEYDQREEYRGRVSWLPEAEELWERISNDEPLTRQLTSEAITAAAPPGSSDGPSGSTDGSPDGSPNGSPSGSPSGEPDDDAVADAEAKGLCA
jgi:LCP family protein required for cell wall assembly